MKTFRQSLLNTSLFKVNFMLTFVVGTMLGAVALVVTQSVWACLGMQVFTKKDEVKVKRYCIDLVAPKDYKELVGMIKARGIVVETEGLEKYLS